MRRALRYRMALQIAPSLLKQLFYDPSNRLNLSCKLQLQWLGRQMIIRDFQQ